MEQLSKVIKNYKMRKCLLKASFSVEASFVIPIVCFFIFTVMTITFYLHDVIILEAKTAYTAEQARMALLYSKIPGKDGIFEGGFDNEFARKVLTLELTVTKTEANADNFFCEAEQIDTKFLIEKLVSGTELKGEKHWYMLLPNEIGNKGICAIRNYTSPMKNLRVSRLVYRLWKEFFNK